LQPVAITLANPIRGSGENTGNPLPWVATGCRPERSHLWDVDLAAVGDLDEALAELNDLGFFAAGLVLHGPDGHDHLRLQLLDSEEIELEDIVCDSSFGEALRRQVLEDKTRVVG
jgi:hypothetical protein